MSLAVAEAPLGFPAAVNAWRWTLSRYPGQPRDRSHDATRRGDVAVQFAGALTDRASAGYGPLPGLDDAAFVAAIYARVGADVFSLLRGAFAVAIVDRQQARTLLGRDHAGLEPVFYRLDAHALYAAPTAASLIASAGAARFNRVALADAACRRFPDAEETLFTDVRRLPAGSFLTYGSGAPRLTRYWNPLPVEGPVRWLHDADMADVEAARVRAIQRCAQPRDSAIFLSGGIDSVSIATTAADEARARGTNAPIALLLGLPHNACDERPTQMAVSRALGLPHHLLDFDEAVGSVRLLDQALAISGAMSSPLLNAWTPPYLALARTGRSLGASTILTGIGGDEWFSTSDLAAADMLMRGRLFELGRFRRVWKRTESAHGFLRYSAIRPIVGALAASVAPRAWDRRRARRTFSSDPRWIAPDAGIRRAQVDRVHATLSPARPIGGFALDESRDTLRHATTSMEMEEFHQLGAWSGVRFRHPYLDPDLVGLLSRTPPRLLDAGGWLKGRIRMPLATRFADLGFATERKRFADALYRTTVLDGAEDHLRTNFPALSTLGVVDGRAAATYALEQMARRRPASRVWDLLSLEAWVAAQLHVVVPQPAKDLTS